MSTTYFLYHQDFRSAHSCSVMVESKCPESREIADFLENIDHVYGQYEVTCGMSLDSSTLTGDKSKVKYVADYLKGKIFDFDKMPMLLMGELATTAKDNYFLFHLAEAIRKKGMGEAKQLISQGLIPEDATALDKSKCCKELGFREWDQYYLGVHYATQRDPEQDRRSVSEETKAQG